MIKTFKQVERKELIQVAMIIALAFLAIVFVYKYSEAASAYNRLVDKYTVCVNNSLTQPIKPAQPFYQQTINWSVT